MSVSTYDKHGDFHLPFDTNAHAPGEIVLTGDLDTNDNPVVALAFDSDSDGFEQTELWFGAFRIEMRDATAHLHTSVILTREQALALAEALTLSVRPIEVRNA